MSKRRNRMHEAELGIIYDMSELADVILKDKMIRDDPEEAIRLVREIRSRLDDVLQEFGVLGLDWELTKEYEHFVN